MNADHLQFLAWLACAAPLVVATWIARGNWERRRRHDAITGNVIELRDFRERRARGTL